MVFFWTLANVIVESNDAIVLSVIIVGKTLEFAILIPFYGTSKSIDY